VELNKNLIQETAKWVVGEDDSGVIKGRAKFCRPVFRFIGKINKGLAMMYFKKHKEGMYPYSALVGLFDSEHREPT